MTSPPDDRTGATDAAPERAAVALTPVRPLDRGTMSRQLIIRVTTLVAVVAVALGALTLLALQGILQGQVDDQLRTFMVQADKGPPGQDGGRAGRPIGRQLGFVQYGDLATWDSATTVRTGIIQQSSGPALVTAAQAAQLEDVPTTSKPTTIALDDLGTYRVMARTSGGQLLVVGLPMSSVLAPVRNLALAAAALTVVAILIAFAAARQVVTGSLRPLRRLATTANTVSGLALDRGEVTLPVRVSPQDTDPRSEVGQVGLAFNHMLDNVEGALAARQRSETQVRQFVADASHELRNPLASIKGYAELTRRNRDELPPATGHALGRIEAESERMSALVEDLLLLARLDSGPAVDRTPTQLNEVLANAVSDAQVAGPDHDWSLSLPDEDVVVLGDPFRLQQVVANLLSNARTHTPAGTAVETSLARLGREAVIRVTDTGPGIPPEIIERVFERFTRADRARARQGGGASSTGLGLAIVQAVMAAHGGTASVASVPGRTSFELRLPLAG
ncbi:sensor histidine kinase [Nigerium massiliense]|uniref:sensor histidine kinase n=1 Tax=Nigerium massiliense TaxID=1522317 RepID=UPI0009E45AF5|nr:HAMP domain-containing sensor histidine kinase [Nigerium massiliense]